MNIDLLNTCNILTTTYDDLLGQYVETLSESINCRIIYKVNKVVDIHGEETVSNIKVILPKDVKIAAEYKIRIDGKDYEIRNLSYKQNLKGILEYIVAYV